MLNNYMSVCSYCLKSTADSEDKYNKTIFLDLSNSCVEYNIFDCGESIVESNTNKEIDDIASYLLSIKIK